MLKSKNMTPLKAQKLHFIGIAGSGMRGLAILAAGQGAQVSGSDRQFDKNLLPELKDIFASAGIALFPQDGSGIHEGLDRVIVTTAAEETIPDYKKTKKMGLPVSHRAEFMSELIRAEKETAVAGTSGKTTVTAILTHLLDKLGCNPTAVFGGEFAAGEQTTLQTPGVRIGGNKYSCYETDESDGSLLQFKPDIGIINNITRDHHELSKLEEMFLQFASGVSENLIINGDDPAVSRLEWNAPKITRFGFSSWADRRITELQSEGWSSHFSFNNEEYVFPLPGKHNIYNAAAALCAVEIACEKKPSPEILRNALKSFPGVKRRLEIIGRPHGIPVIDDFAHNPAKIAASLDVLSSLAQRIVALFQPHGFQPTRFMFDELIQVFRKKTGKEDSLILLPVFYAGGTASQDVSSERLAAELKKYINVHTVSSHQEAASRAASEASEGSAVVVMGARDARLTELCRSIIKNMMESGDVGRPTPFS